VGDLRAWHYHDPFFQESPGVFGVNLDAIYAKADVVKVAREFFAGVGLPVDEILARSDLYEKPGKNPHAYCSNMDREGDVRIVCNIVPSERWMETTLHELGHAVYATPNIPRSVPYVLRGPSHSFTTEGVAIFFGDLSKRADWMVAMGLPVGDAKAVEEVGGKMWRNQVVIFAAWSQVMFRFEMGMYGNPEQDLNKLWWDLVERHQMVKRPEGRDRPDYASKIHICGTPGYYHNYMMGRMFAAQVRAMLDREIAWNGGRGVYNGRKAVGEILKRRVFESGARLRWDGFVKSATGEELSARALLGEVGVGGNDER
jgi:peptidyl-dipeptidase A